MRRYVAESKVEITVKHRHVLRADKKIKKKKCHKQRAVEMNCDDNVRSDVDLFTLHKARVKYHFIKRSR